MLFISLFFPTIWVWDFPYVPIREVLVGPYKVIDGVQVKADK